MKNRLLLDQIKASFQEGYSDSNRKKWAKYVLEQKIPLTDLYPLIYAENQVANQFAWMLGDLCEMEASFVFPLIPQLFVNRKKIKNANFNRSLSKYFYWAGIPKEIEGEALTALFDWLNDPKSIVSTKTNSMLALYKLTEEYPDLKIELKASIEGQLETTSISFQKKAAKLLREF